MTVPHSLFRLEMYTKCPLFDQDNIYSLTLPKMLPEITNHMEPDLTPSQDVIHLVMHIRTNLTAVKLPEKHLDTLITAIGQLQETPHHISQVIWSLQQPTSFPPTDYVWTLTVGSDRHIKTHFLKTGISPCQQRKRSDRF